MVCEMSAYRLLVGFLVFLVGFLVGLLVGLLTGLLIGLLVGSLVGFLVGLPSGLLVGRLAGFLEGLLELAEENPIRPTSATCMELHRSKQPLHFLQDTETTFGKITL